MLTDCLLTCCALRTRVNMSAIGSLMLICFPLPAGFSHARHFATHGHFAQFMTRQSEFAVNTTSASGYGTACTQTGRAGVTRQTLKLETSLVAFFVGF